VGKTVFAKAEDERRLKNKSLGKAPDVLKKNHATNHVTRRFAFLV